MASHDDPSSERSSSDGEEAPVEWMVKKRERRTNFGNRMSKLLQTQEDEDMPEEFKELEEDIAEEGEYREGDDDGEADMSLSEDEDEDAEHDGDEELAGEKELKKQERVEKQKKRKAQNALLKPPLRKRARIAPTARSSATPTASTAPVPRSRKRLGHESYLPEVASAVTRQSSRTATVENKQRTKANLIEKEENRLRVVANMAAIAEKKRKTERPPMTQLDRLAEAAKVEKRNSKSLYKWEEAEKRREAEREAKLEASKNRKLDGPFIRLWSGSVTWEGDQIKVNRIHRPHTEVVEDKLATDKHPVKDGLAINSGGTALTSNASNESRDAATTEMPAELDKDSTVAPKSPDALTAPSQGPLDLPKLTTQGPDEFRRSSVHEPIEPQKDLTLSEALRDAAAQQLLSAHQNRALALQPTDANDTPHDRNGPHPGVTSHMAPSGPADFLDGIHYYASLPDQPKLKQPSTMYPQSPSSRVHPRSCPPTPTLTPTSAHTSLQLAHSAQSRPSPLPAPVPPKIKEQAMRSLVIICDFRDYEHLTTIRDRTEAHRRILLNFVGKTTKSSKSPTPKTLCVITSQPARFRDPRTGLPYSNAHAYKNIQGLVAGNYQWSNLLGAFVGLTNGALSGRPADGTPEKFWWKESRSATEFIKREEAPLIGSIT
ncbi:YL1 nuclear protein-domain-containing protein [Cryomyces antarcticus]